jgi:hypothetical protein
MNKKNDRDTELDNLLKPLKASEPSDLQMQRWMSTALKESQKNKEKFFSFKFNTAFQLAAAMFVGVIIGAVSFNSDSSFFKSSNNIAQNSFSDATFERSHANLN